MNVTRQTDNIVMIDASFDAVFEALYRNLTKAFPHPFDWVCVLHRPRWYRFAARRAHKKVVLIFASHGFALSEREAEMFFASEPQGFDEDCGGAIIRRLRQAFQWQTGVPYFDGMPK